MANILCKTRGGSSPQGKPRVYFTCHPVDFEKFFEKICADIFATHDCAVYYTEDMTAPIPEADWETDLGSNNLFVVPVTLKLLTQPNRAMDSDIPYALQKHLPVLPIMMEPGLDMIYARPDRFGELQYLQPGRADLTELPYEDKLKKYLESVLISEKMAKRVRDAFDAYIFLSYRKKDRRYANELMRLIHKNPEYRDIAIWYDEFLTPGESFRANIEKALEKSQLFTLLVTPNLLEEPNGKPNFVMGQEYPAARNSGIDILPAEMEETNKDLLQKSYPGIPGCVNARNDAALRERLLSAIDKMAVPGNNNDPEHMFLIGLAYLEGIDVETNRERGLALITRAAEANLPEAMRKLWEMYYYGMGISHNYQQALRWAKRLSEYSIKTVGERDADSLMALGNLASSYDKVGEKVAAFEVNERLLGLAKDVRGTYDRNTLLAQMNLAVSCGELGDLEKALHLLERTYAMQAAILGEECADTIATLANIGVAYGEMGDHQKELEFAEKAYALWRKTEGEESPHTLRAMHNVAMAYCKLGQKQIGLEMLQKAYDLQCKVKGEEDPETLDSLYNLAAVIESLGNIRKALELRELLYARTCKSMGEEHPDALDVLHELAGTYCTLENYAKAMALTEKVYNQRRKILGEKNKDTLLSMNDLAKICCETGSYQDAVEIQEEAYRLSCIAFGELSEEALFCLHNLAVDYAVWGKIEKSRDLFEMAYSQKRRVFEEDHPETQRALRCLRQAEEMMQTPLKYERTRAANRGTYRNLAIRQETLEEKERIYAEQRNNLGEESHQTLMTMTELAISYFEAENYPKAVELFNKACDIRLRNWGEDHEDTRKTIVAADRARQKLRELRKVWKNEGRCWYCGGKFKGLFKRVCSQCGKPKNY